MYIEGSSLFRLNIKGGASVRVYTDGDALVRMFTQGGALHWKGYILSYIYILGCLPRVMYL